MGLNASSDKWCRHSDVAVEGLEWCMKIVDDIIIWATTTEEMWTWINIVLDRCKNYNITISRNKLEMGDEIEFAGHIISHRDIKPDRRSSKHSGTSRHRKTSKSYVSIWVWPTS